MKALIVYDSMYGNTEKIAKAIGGAIGNEVKVLRIGEVNPSELEAIELLSSSVRLPKEAGRQSRFKTSSINCRNPLLKA